MRGATARGVGCPSTEGGLGGLRTSGSCSFVFSTRHVLCRISVLLHHASISGAVRCVVWGEGCVGVRGCMGWYGRELSLCRDTVFNLAESPLRERFFPCTHGFPRCPPHADARSWARHRSVGKGCAGGVLGVWEGRCSAPECGSGWGSGGGVENGAPSAQATGSVSSPRRTCRSDRDLKGSARARQKLGGGWQDASGLADPCIPHLTPYPRRRLGSDLQNSGLFFSSALVRKNAACLSSSPAARHRSPPPTSHRPSTAPAAQSMGWRTHRAGKRRSTQAGGVRGLSLAP